MKIASFSWETFEYGEGAKWDTCQHDWGGGAYLSCPPYLGVVFPKDKDGTFYWGVVQYGGEFSWGHAGSLAEAQKAVEDKIRKLRG